MTLILYARRPPWPFVLGSSTYSIEPTLGALVRESAECSLSYVFLWLWSLLPAQKVFLQMLCLLKNLSCTYPLNPFLELQVSH